jgi:RHS repeat-associated protein
LAVSQAATYNAKGNITSKTVGGNTFTYSYGYNSHKHAVTGVTYNGIIPYPYSYDANGNMTYGTDFTNLGSIQARTITYNADNMPTQIVHSSNGTTELTYGGTGERVKKRVYSGGNVTDTYYIGDHFEVKGGETIKYIFAGNLRVAQVKGTTRSFFHKDHLGSSTVMTDASGYELEYSDYAPFGSQRAYTGTNTSDYKYTDQELDAENGLYNYNARLYDPFIGRFISPDTIVPDPYNPQSLNRYTYCLNNPLNYTDPSGHFWEWGEEFWKSLKGLWGSTWQNITDAFSQLGGWLGFGRAGTVTVGPLMDDYGNTYGGALYPGGGGGGGNGGVKREGRILTQDEFPIRIYNTDSLVGSSNWVQTMDTNYPFPGINRNPTVDPPKEKQDNLPYHYTLDERKKLGRGVYYFEDSPGMDFVESFNLNDTFYFHAILTEVTYDYDAQKGNILTVNKAYSYGFTLGFDGIIHSYGPRPATEEEIREHISIVTGKEEFPNYSFK